MALTRSGDECGAPLYTMSRKKVSQGAQRNGRRVFDETTVSHYGAIISLRAFHIHLSHEHRRRRNDVANSLVHRASRAD